MTLRQLRKRLTPAWLRPDARRRRRDILFRRFGMQRSHAPHFLTRRPELAARSCLPFVVAHELIKNPELTFIQVGAFDGVSDDDMRELIVTHCLRGVLVEPQPTAFARLKELYRDQPQVTLLEAAIAEREGVRDLYCQLGVAGMTASFDRAHLRKHGIADHEIVAQPVICHTIESAVRAGGLEHVDLIQIDAEGYDWPIIQSIDFARLRPHILRFEFRHMSRGDADACLALLADAGYRFVVETDDIIAHLVA
jgi:FkbM family methyltransferase